MLLETLTFYGFHQELIHHYEQTSLSQEASVHRLFLIEVKMTETKTNIHIFVNLFNQVCHILVKPPNVFILFTYILYRSDFLKYFTLIWGV